MPDVLQVESTLTDRYQTTVPETVRRALRRAATGESDDPALAPFLGFLARDMAEHPERLQIVDAGLVRRIQALVDGVDVDPDATLSADDE